MDMPKKPERVSIVLGLAEVDLVLQSMGSRPYDMVADLIANIRTQVLRQFDEFNAPPAPEPVLPLYSDETNYDRTSNWLFACGKACAPDNLSVQIGCDMEEATELWDCVEISDVELRDQMTVALQALALIGVRLKTGRMTAAIRESRRVDALDALCDREVTGNGVAFLAGFNKNAADKAVLDSNDAKLVNGKPVILEGGKIGKPPGWKAPDLTRFV